MTIRPLRGMPSDEFDEYRGGLVFAATGLSMYALVRSCDLERVLHAVMKAVDHVSPDDVIAALHALTGDRP